MCGIAGIFNYADPDRPVDRALLERMTRSLAHRGPDGEGIHIDGPIGLGHRRLAIVDLSPTGFQPMLDGSADHAITYNGELYNHRSFRSSLEGRHTFRGTSDTETLLYLMAERGPGALAEAAGIFAFGFWDKRARTLTLARDPLGVKQVYYYDDGRRLLFASEIKALLECPEVPRELDVEGLNQYLHFHTPLFERTFFRGIHQLRPGEYATVDRRGLRTTQYWALTDFRPSHASPEEAIEQLREELAQVVSDQLMSDVPVGAFFSGGIDSTAVASFAKRTGYLPRCFGVHFSGQGVIDERPYQESAARALGLPLELITLDGSTFPEDLRKLIYFQDQPVIGPALLPMYAVSQLASRQVKVCLGGQASDEIFGGYARYALAAPVQAVGNWIAGRLEQRRSARSAVAGASGAAVGGNLWRQLADVRNLSRLARNVRNLVDWRAAYFEHFAKVPQSDWRTILGDDALVSRASARRTFDETVSRSAAADPVGAVMHWDVQTYLPGLFQQDDRMSMANSLESRVPLADPRLVRFAFHIPTELKIRGGASKWILRQAVADVIPAEVLNRRKVGFDTPVERWMQAHPNFVRDVFGAARARQRGLWNPRSLDALVDAPNRFHYGQEVLWKALSIELWAQTFLDAAPARASSQPSIELRSGDEPAPRPLHSASLRDNVQEVRELGVRGTLFRASWELKQRSGLAPLFEDRSAEPAPGPVAPTRAFTRWREVAERIRPRISADALRELEHDAEEAARGRIRCFGRWMADYGQPIDWHLNPTNGRHWDAQRHWSQVLRQERSVGDVKYTWEAARFPQAYRLARAAAFFPERRAEFAQTLAEQLQGFIAANPFRLGVHWNSGQEIIFRMMAWQFALSVFHDEPAITRLAPEIATAYAQALQHVDEHRAYAERAVYNNHLISELMAGIFRATAWPGRKDTEAAEADAIARLCEQCDRQFYVDGGYLQQSHTYERVALSTLAFAAALLRDRNQPVPATFLRTFERGLEFLHAHQNPADGKLPNYGANDGSQPLQLSTCGFTDFRPSMQALSLMARGKRLYPEGPWDELSAWLLGPESLDAPLEPMPRRTRSFPVSGHHVLRGKDEGTFATFRCGTLRDRFSQIDMLHVDLFWRGENVLVDGGSYQYNAADRWHAHFLRTESHNTVQVDGHDQMLHHRRFKTLYRTQAQLLELRDEPGWSLAVGEHAGFARFPGRCMHRRSVLAVKDGLWVVVDRVGGEGEHQVRLHWLTADLPHSYDAAQGRLTLQAEAGPLSVTVVDALGAPLAGDVVRGASEPPRGWQARYYGEKLPAPSLAVERRVSTPTCWVTVISEGVPVITVDGTRWQIAAGERSVSFVLQDGEVNEITPLRTPKSQP